MITSGRFAAISFATAARPKGGIGSAKFSGH